MITHGLIISRVLGFVRERGRNSPGPVRRAHQGMATMVAEPQLAFKVKMAYERHFLGFLKPAGDYAALMRIVPVTMSATPTHRDAVIRSPKNHTPSRAAMTTENSRTAAMYPTGPAA